MEAVIILGLVILILIIGFVVLKETEAPEGIKPLTDEEKELIEAWVLENNLNQYGDSKDTVYMGGTPLFDEKTGKSIDKYEYILKNHPDRPWKK